MNGKKRMEIEEHPQFEEKTTWFQAKKHFMYSLIICIFNSSPLLHATAQQLLFSSASPF
jgi:hypothetical protein